MATTDLSFGSRSTLVVALIVAAWAQAAISQTEPHDTVPLEFLALTGTASGGEGDGFVFGAATFGGGDSLLYSWDFGDGTAPVTRFDGAGMNHRYMEDGTYQLVVKVDGVGESVARRMTVEVQPRPPKIDLLVAERTHGDDGTSRYDFSAMVTDPGDDDLVAIWDFGDGTPARTGEELFDVDHAYRQDGRYVLTLTVKDEDGLTATRTRVITVGNSVHVDVTGDANAAIRTGNGPVYACVTPLGDGGCGVHLQFWDDVNRSYLFLQNYANPVLRRRSYPMVAGDRRQLAEGAHVAEATGIVSAGMRDTDYEGVQNFLKITSCDPSSLPELDFGSILQGGLESLTRGGIRRIGRRLLRSIPGGELLGDPGSGGGGGNRGGPTGGGWAAESGSLEVTAIDEHGIRGTVDAVMFAKDGRRKSSVQVEGSFSAAFGDHVQPFLDMCLDGPFEIAGRHPEPDADRVFSGDPDVWVQFTRPLDRDSVHGESVRLEVKKADGSGFERVPTRQLVDTDTLRVHLVPWIELDPARQHRVVVVGGADGVRSRSGKRLGSEEQWTWTTLIDLYRRPDRDQQARGRASWPPEPRVARAVERGPAAPQFEYAVLRGNESLQMATPAQTVPTSRGDFVPSVQCQAIQVAAGRPLVTDKTTLFRVDLQWQKGDVTSLPSGTVKSVTVQDGGCESDCIPLYGTANNTVLPTRWYHPETITGVREVRRKAEQSALIYGWPAGRHLSSVKAKVVLVDSDGREHERFGDCAISHWQHAGNPVEKPVLRIALYKMPQATWPRDPITGYLPSNDDIRSFLGGSLSYLIQNFPITGVEARFWELVETGELQDDGKEIELLPESLTESLEEKRNLAMGLRLQRTLKQQGRLDEADVHAFVNSARMSEEGFHKKLGISFYYFTSGRRDTRFDARFLHVAYDNARPEGGVNLAHEVGHTFDLRHRDQAKIDGFRLFRDSSRIEGEGTDTVDIVVEAGRGFFKHTHEGNAEDPAVERPLFPLLSTGAETKSYGRSDLFITATYYDQLLQNLGAYFAQRDSAAEQ